MSEPLYSPQALADALNAENPALGMSRKRVLTMIRYGLRCHLEGKRRKIARSWYDEYIQGRE